MKHLVLATTLVALTCACTSPAPELPPEPAPVPQCLPDKSCCQPIAARVGSVVLTEAELEARIQAAVERAEALCDDDPELPARNIARDPADFRRDCLIDFVLNALTDSIAARNNISLTAEEIAAARAEFEKTYETTVEETAQLRYGSVDEFMTVLERSLLSDKISATLVPHPAPVTDEEVKAEFEKRTAQVAALKEEFAGYRKAIAAGTINFDALVAEHSLLPNEITLRDDSLELFLSPEAAEAVRATPAGELCEAVSDEGVICLIKVLKRIPPQESDGTETIAELSTLRERILAGEDFAALAKAYSDCPSGTLSGGDLGEFARGQIGDEFDAIAFAQPLGEISPVFKTIFGYHILKVTARNDETGAITVSHILLEPDRDPAMTQVLALIKPLPLPGDDLEALRDEMASARHDAAYFEVLSEQLKAIGISIPADPSLETSLLNSFLLP